MRTLFAEKARLGMPVEDMTPKQATEALHRLRVRFGKDGVEALARSGTLETKGAFGLSANLGPAKLVKQEMEKLLGVASQHRRLQQPLAKVLKQSRDAGQSTRTGNGIAFYGYVSD